MDDNSAAWNGVRPFRFRTKTLVSANLIPQGVTGCAGSGGTPGGAVPPGRAGTMFVCPR
jgi:hypothetical protein